MFPPQPPPILAPFFSLDEFNDRLRGWLAAGSARTVGADDLTKLPVRIGLTFCWLAEDTTRAGVSAYLDAVSVAEGVYSVVHSSEFAVRRVVPGRTPERIPGFYLYAKEVYDSPQVINPATAPMDDIAIALLLLEGVAVLHQRGHQRLRIYPKISGSGLHWRTMIVDVDSARFGDSGWPDLESSPFAYTTGSHYDVGGMLVDAGTTAGEVADRILGKFPDPLNAGRGRDWMYAGWYAEMLGSAREHNNLPVGDEPHIVEGERRWPFLPGVGKSIPQPPLPAPLQVRC